MKKQLKTDLYGVIGLGRFGTALVQTLAEAGKEVIAIDKTRRRSRRCAAIPTTLLWWIT